MSVSYRIRSLHAAFIVLSAALLPASTLSRCLHYEDYVHSVMTMASLSLCRDVCCNDAYAFVAAGNEGLLVVDISDPLKGECVASLQVGYGVAVSWYHDHVYMACGYDGVRIIDVSTPSSPVLVGAIDTPDFAYDIVVRDDRAYVADRTSGLLLLDVGDRSTPVIARDGLPPADAYCVLLHEDLLFVGGYDSGLSIYELGRPGIPLLIATLELPDVALDLSVRDETLYAATGNFGVTAIDIGDPRSCSICWTYKSMDLASGIEILGSRLFVAAMEEGVLAFDIIDPCAPVYAGRLDTGQAYGVTAHAGRCVIANGSLGLRTALSVDSPFAQTLSETANVYGTHVSCQGDLLCAATTHGWGTGDIKFFKLDTSGDIIFLSTLHYGLFPIATTFNGNNLVVSDRVFGLRMVDISDPFHPVHVGSTPIYATIFDTVVQGDYAYLATDRRGLRVVDISEPTNPVRISYMPYPTDLLGITIQDGLAYLAADANGLVIVDIDNPAVPLMVSMTALSSPAVDVDVIGEICCMAASMDGIVILDVSNPEDPEIIGGYRAHDTVISLALASNTAYLVTEDSGVLILDISDPTAPYEKGGFPDFSGGRNMELGEDYACLASSSEGLIAFARQCGDETTACEQPYLPTNTPLPMTVFPNPCNPGTTISFELADNEYILLAIYDARGRRIQVLVDDWLDRGRHVVQWDGRSYSGESIPTGVYFSRIDSAAGSSTEKIVILK